MPNEILELNYIKGYPNNKVPILSSEPLGEKDLAGFDNDEIEAFDARFEAIFKWVNTDGVAPIATKAHHDELLHLAEVQKKVYGGVTFTGDGSSGWGMRDIVPEDVFGNAADTVWELGNGTTVANWTCGVPATRWARNDMGLALRNTLTFAAGTAAVTQDAAQDKWAVAYFGMADLASSGNIQGHAIALNRKPREFFEFTNQMQLSNVTYADLGKICYFNHMHPFNSGAIVKPATVATTVALATVTALRPVGVTFLSQRRAVQTALLTNATAA